MGLLKKSLLVLLGTFWLAPAQGQVFDAKGSAPGQFRPSYSLRPLGDSTSSESRWGVIGPDFQQGIGLAPRSRDQGPLSGGPNQAAPGQAAELPTRSGAGKASRRLSLPFYSQAKSLRQDSTLRRVRFVDSQVGVAVGDRGAILRTVDGGRSWHGVPSPTELMLSDLVWTGSRSVIAVGGGYESITQISRGVVLRSQDAGKTWKIISANDVPRLGRIKRLSDGALLAAGDWSHLMLHDHFISVDRGRTWSSASKNEPRLLSDRQTPLDELTHSFQFRHWIGNRRCAPVRHLCVIPQTPLKRSGPNDSEPNDPSVEPKRLCSVHDHGTICVSEDGGQTWKRCRGEKRRTQILFVAARPSDVPWALVGNESLQWRNRVSVLLTEASTASTKQQQLAMQVAVSMGAAGVDFLSASSRAVSDEEAKRQLLLHRPRVVVMDQSVSSVWQESFETSAPSNGVQRVLRSHRHSPETLASGSAFLHDRAMLPRIGMLVSDLTRDSLQLISPHHPDAAPRRARSIGLRRIYDVSGSSLGGSGDSIMEGLASDRNAQLTAKPVRISRHRLQVAQARVQQTQRLLQTLAKAGAGAAVEPLVDQLLRQTSMEDRRRLVWSLYRFANRPMSRDHAGLKNHGELKDRMLRVIEEHFTNEAIGAWANLQRRAKDSSVEYRELKDSPTLVSPAMAASRAPGLGRREATVAVSPFQTTPASLPREGFVRQASANMPIQSPERSAATQQTQPSSLVDLQFDLHPATLLAYHALARRVHPHQSMSPELTRVAQSGVLDWRALLHRVGPKTINAKSTSTPPKLDGSLDDEVWQGKAYSFGRHARVRVAYDDRFVFLAIQSDANLWHPDAIQSRSRDQNLGFADRLQISIDVDRDLITAYQLEVTDAGRTRDSVDGQVAWQPTWYFDVQRNQDSSVFEIAIKKENLQFLPLDQPEWFLSIELISPKNPSDSNTLFPDARKWARVVFR